MSAPSPLLSKALHVTCLRVVLGKYQRRSLTFSAFVQAYVAKVIRYKIVGELLQIFQENSYFLRPAKCEFEVSKIECLGVIVDGTTLSVDPKKADRLHNWPRTLTTVKEVRSVLGVLGYQ